jgi:hypothetical protein
MSDIFDLFSDEPPTPRSDSDKKEPPARAARAPRIAQPLAPARVADTPEHAAITGKIEQLVEQLARAVGDLPGDSADFHQEPDLTMLAYAVSDILESAGHPAEALSADRWARYEASGRRASKIAEARARAEEVYRGDLTAIRDPRPPLYLTTQSNLPWRLPDAPTVPPRPLPDEHEP